LLVERSKEKKSMSILWFILFGLIVGFIARAIMPGKQSMGFVMTALVGIVGSFVGGAIGNLVSGRSFLQLQSAGIIGSIIGALIVLAILGWVGRRRAFA
jgi:uncharacterized membrane protein YeaQ/YmgE (transglycosylase-associated protein family)